MQQMISNETVVKAKPESRVNILLHALLFVLGFTIVFVVGWGGAVTIIGNLFGQYKIIIGRIGGAVLIVFGLATMDIIRIPWFYMDTRPEYRGHTGTYFGSIAMGLFFAAGWSPCIGATLGAILTLGFSQDTVGQAMILSSGYSLGLGIPFLLLALAMDRASIWIIKLKKHIRIFQIVSGVMIIVIGLLLLTNSLTLIARWGQDSGLYLDLITIVTSSNLPDFLKKLILAIFPMGVVPSYRLAVAAGVLSFLSPCVLPLVPAYLGYLSGHMVASARQVK